MLDDGGRLAGLGREEEVGRAAVEDAEPIGRRRESGLEPLAVEVGDEEEPLPAGDAGDALRLEVQAEFVTSSQLRGGPDTASLGIV
jgi:hypothetical protein